MGAFGEKLRKQRELRGIELDAISNTTKISTRMLRALEDEHFDQLPGGVFNKGFVRAYARQIGLDEEEAVAGYLAAARAQQQSNAPDLRAQPARLAPVAAPELPGHAVGENAPPSHDLLASNKDDKDGGNDHHDELGVEDRRHKPSRRNDERRGEDRRSSDDDRRDKDRRNKDRRNHPRASRFRQKYPAGDPEPADQSTTPIPWGKLALALLVVTLILALWNFRRQTQPTAASPAVASSRHSAAPTPQPAPTQPSASTSPAASPSPAVPMRIETPPSAIISAPTTPPVNPPQPNAKPPAIHTPAPAPKPPSTFTLQIRAEKTTWVSLTADGNPVVTNETLIAPAHTSARATREIIVKTGNGAAITFLLNGKEIPVQGNEGEPKTYIFNATGIQAAP